MIPFSCLCAKYCIIFQKMLNYFFRFSCIFIVVFLIYTSLIFLFPFPAPCPPTNVSAELNCTTRKALVSWSNAAEATGYSVQATSVNGHNSSCSEMGTSCHLNNLVCGQEYSVVVEAMHTGCPGPASAPATLDTGGYNVAAPNLRASH